MNVYICFAFCLSGLTLLPIDVLLDKKNEILDTMINHGIMAGLSEIFSTCQDEDTLV